VDHKSILITGCSSGIGYECAKILKNLGYRVFATARKSEDVAKLKSEGFECESLDYTKPNTIKSSMQWVLEQNGGQLYALFNNGAYGQPGAIEDLQTEVLKEQFETNFFGWHELTRLVTPIMRAQGYGRIVQHSSVLGLTALPFRGAYNASKFAIEGYTDTLRLELKGSGIYVSTLDTGPVRSRFRANALRKFEEHIDVQNSPFKESYERQYERLKNQNKDGAFTLNPDAVAKKLLHALEAKRPKERYYITTATHILGGLKRILSTSMLDFVLKKISENE